MFIRVDHRIFPMNSCQVYISDDDPTKMMIQGCVLRWRCTLYEGATAADTLTTFENVSKEIKAGKSLIVLSDCTP